MAKSKYDPLVHDVIAANAAAMGLTMRELSELFGIAEQTIYLWFSRSESLSAAYRSNAQQANKRVEDSLYQAAVYGQRKVVTKTTYDNKGNITGSTTQETLSPPMYSAMCTWLYNRTNEWKAISRPVDEEAVDADVQHEVIMRIIGHSENKDNKGNSET